MAEEIKPNINYSKYFILGIGLVGLIFILLLISPFVTLLISTFVLYYMFNPIYKFLLKPIKKRGVSALLTCLLIVLLILMFILPFVISLNSFSYTELWEVRNTFIEQSLQKTGEETCTGFVGSIDCIIKDVLEENPTLKSEIEAKSGEFINSIVTFVFLDMPVKLFYLFIYLFIMFFILFYLFLDGEKFFQELKKILPIDEKMYTFLSNRFKIVFSAIIYGTIIIALVQALVATIGYIVILRSETAILLGILTFIAALIPYVGAGLIYLPVGLYKLLTSITFNDPWGVMQAAGILLWGLLVVSTIDNIIKPKIIGGKANIHPLVIFLGLLGGIPLFGLFGFIIGPLLLAITIDYLKYLWKER